MSLSKNYPDEACTLLVDNFYTNIELTKTLLEIKAHILDTLRKNVKDHHTLNVCDTSKKSRPNELVLKPEEFERIILNNKYKAGCIRSDIILFYSFTWSI